MAVFRIEKTKDYTVMSNHHLRNKNLSLKAKGLLCLMLSLPDEWEYSTKGLAYICKEGVDSISNIVKELELNGYIVRKRIRNKRGYLTTIEYTIYEYPQTDLPIVEKPKRENPVLDNPVLDNTAQLNTNISNKEKLNIDVLNTYPILSSKTDFSDRIGNEDNYD